VEEGSHHPCMFVGGLCGGWGRGVERAACKRVGTLLATG
jgi:hypothetical protein